MMCFAFGIWRQCECHRQWNDSSAVHTVRVNRQKSDSVRARRCSPSNWKND
jgi:hypothetical protein